jgi:flagellar motility protein MotE (MotC chaperone)
MADNMAGLDDLINRVEYPVTKEELVNALLAENAGSHEVALADRLPRSRYKSKREVEEDLEEISRVHEAEIAPAETFQDYLEQVIRHVGDVTHTTKASYNSVVDRVVKIAQSQGKLDETQAREMRLKLEAAFADVRGPMTLVEDPSAPLDPTEDLPRTRT